MVDLLSAVFRALNAGLKENQQLTAPEVRTIVHRHLGGKSCEDLAAEILRIGGKFKMVILPADVSRVAEVPMYEQPVLVVNNQTEQVMVLTAAKGRLLVTTVSKDGSTQEEDGRIPDIVEQVKAANPDATWWLVSMQESMFGSLLFDIDLTDTDMAGKPLKRFLRMLAPDVKDIGFVYLYAIFGGLINLSLPLGIQAIINQISSGELVTSWLVLIIFIIVGIMLTGGMQIMQLSIIEFLQQRVFVRAAFQFADKIPRLRFESLAGQYPPELVNRFFDVLSVQKGLSKILMDFSTSTLQILFGLLLLALYHPFFIAFGVLLLAVLFIIIRYTGPSGLSTSLTESKFKYKVVYWLEDVARNLVSFKLGGYQNLVFEKLDVLVAGYLNARKAHFRILMFQFANIILFKVLVTAGLLIIGSILVFRQEINVGQFVAAEIVIILLLVSVEKLIRTLETVYDVLTAVEKIGDVIDLEEEYEGGVGFNLVDLESKGMALEARNLGYTYADAEKPVLEGINFSVHAGERICIAGFNGSGRSTLINILSGLFSNYSGTLLINGIPAGNINMDSLRAHIGDNLTSETIFGGTLEENITLGKPYIGYDKLKMVTAAIGLSDFVNSLPEGFNTPLVADDRRISDSTVRKIVLARSIICEPRLLLMDDFLLNVHPGQLNTLLGYLTNTQHTYTLLAVSNNVVVAEACDRVMILEDGRVRAIGTFAEVAQQGFGHMFNNKNSPGDEN